MDITEVEVTSTNGWRPSRRMPDVRVKLEDVMDGLIKCPSCNFGLQVSDHGCNLVTCRRPHPPDGKWFYFCFHCRCDLGAGDMCKKCPWRNTKDDRKAMLLQRNAIAQQNPIMIEQTLEATDVVRTHQTTAIHDESMTRIFDWLSDANGVVTFGSLRRAATACGMSLDEEDIYEMLSCIESGTWNIFEAFCKKHEML